MYVVALAIKYLKYKPVRSRENCCFGGNAFDDKSQDTSILPACAVATTAAVRLCVACLPPMYGSNEAMKTSKSSCRAVCAP
jgi:hypothetical protein